MQVTLRSTTKIVTLITPSGEVPTRIWEGATAAGIEVHAYVTRIAADQNADTTQFDAELQEHRAPSPRIEAIPLRLIL